MRILFASSELYPLIKTGGLADVSYSLPKALHELGHDIRIVLPFYRAVKRNVNEAKCIFRGKVFGFDGELRIFEFVLKEGAPLKVWLVDAPGLFDRDGSPYADAYHQPWADSAYMFATFSRVVAMLALDQCGLSWQPDVLHGNDWQTGLAIPLVQREPNAPGTVFTIHNLAYQGNFTKAEFDALFLPKEWWSIDGIEFYGKCSFLKAGVLFADYVTTVSPHYAQEVVQPEFGEGFDGILRHRGERFVGILNGADYAQWNPVTDALIEANYSAADLAGKQRNKRALQQRFGLAAHADVPLFGMVCRMVWQKGADLVIDAIPDLARRKLQIVLLGNGEAGYEAALKALQATYPDTLVVQSGYDETLAHQIEAGADFFLMPSRYEPCGLNQIYSLKYGTLPIVRATGGLVDTVVDTHAATLSAGTATGFLFESATAPALIHAVERALDCYRHPTRMHQLQQQAMAQNFGWDRSSRHYETLYRSCISFQSSRSCQSPHHNVLPTDALVVVSPTESVMPPIKMRPRKRGHHESAKEIP